ncbi:TetR/AcrR family transcriptional regulator [Solwaraspora sp. WMMD791]|uniref:TetR/AcrR family transcriptional regulator n=1 Tax=Solwaraspora sp. WMMD791 TaxID=3016086 RepID=UPI00249C15E1|nr:TetR/AcrR family transcriptional regulator [Solwaraspora sp. WMMD791]WFE24809.1 TetR/AcrR family transcriptional regulator [Solwaraspora sp. WMMD791]
MTQSAAERGRQVRARLRAAAVTLIAERGWSAVSTRVVADRAGVAPGLVHYHYPSVRALLIEAATTAVTDLTADLGALLTTAATPADGVRSMLAALDGYSGTDPTSLLFAETYLAAARDDDLRRTLAGVLDDLRGRLADWLAGHGVADPAATAAVLAAAVDGLLLHRPLSPALTSGVAAGPLTRMIVIDATTESATTGSATTEGDRQ